MRAGALRRRIALQVRDTSKDDYGQQVATWTDYMTGVPAEIEPLSGRALEAARVMQSEVSHLITVRYTPMLANPLKIATMRAVYANGGTTRYFDIGAAINVEERNKEIRIYASEGLSLG